MAKKLKVRRIGNSLGVILPKEILEQLRVEEGDGLDYSASKDGVRLFATNPDFAKELAVFKSLGRRYRNALGELAK
jgi:putative addiction module antidote